MFYFVIKFMFFLMILTLERQSGMTFFDPNILEVYQTLVLIVHESLHKRKFDPKVNS